MLALDGPGQEDDQAVETAGLRFAVSAELVEAGGGLVVDKGPDGLEVRALADADRSAEGCDAAPDTASDGPAPPNVMPTPRGNSAMEEQ